MPLFDAPIAALDGSALGPLDGRAVLVVDVASRVVAVEAALPR